MSSSAPVFGIVAGEASGDLLGQNLIKHLKQNFPSARFVGVGGEYMLKEGLEPLAPIETLSVMGLIEPLKKLPQILKLRNQLLRFFKKNPPLCFIGIDAPDFNLRIEHTLKKSGIKTIHLVSPTVWAWREKRIFSIKKAVDMMLLIFPFEKPFYDKHQMPAVYIGHPLADEIPLHSDQKAARRQLGLNENGQYLALMPGSREAEIRYLGPRFFEAAMRVHQQYPHMQFLVACLNEKRKAQLIQHLKGQFDLGRFQFFVGQATQVMQASDVILLASGTASLQAALIKRPFVVAYRMSGLTFQIAKRLVKIKMISLPNIIAGKKIVPELVQTDATAENMSRAIMMYLNHPEQKEALQEAFMVQHQQLRCGAGERAAMAIKTFLQEHEDKRSNMHGS